MFLVSRTLWLCCSGGCTVDDASLAEMELLLWRNTRAESRKDSYLPGLLSCRDDWCDLSWDCHIAWAPTAATGQPQFPTV